MGKKATLFFVVLAAALPVFNTASAAVTIPDPTVDDQPAATKGERTIVLAGGCFWGVEAVFEQLNEGKVFRRA